MGNVNINLSLFSGLMSATKESVPVQILKAGCDLIGKCLDLKKLSLEAQKVVKQAAEAAPDETQEIKVPNEVLEELKSEVRKIAEEQATPVFADCAIFFCVPLDEYEQELLERIITNVNGEYEPWENESTARHQEIVDEFMYNYIGDYVKMGDSCFIGKDYITLNFSDRSIEESQYCEEDLRQLAIALNCILRGRYITSFSVS